MVPLPGAAFEERIVLLPEQNDELPVMLVVGFAFTVTTNAVDVVEQPLLFVTLTVKLPAMEGNKNYTCAISLSCQQITDSDEGRERRSEAPRFAQKDS